MSGEKCEEEAAKMLQQEQCLIFSLRSVHNIMSGQALLLVPVPGLRQNEKSNCKFLGKEVRLVSILCH